MFIRFASLPLLLKVLLSFCEFFGAINWHCIDSVVNKATMSKWKVEEPKTPTEDALREEDLQYGTSGLTEEELAAKYAVEQFVLRNMTLTSD